MVDFSARDFSDEILSTRVIWTHNDICIVKVVVSSKYRENSMIEGGYSQIIEENSLTYSRFCMDFDAMCSNPQDYWFISRQNKMRKLFKDFQESMHNVHVAHACLEQDSDSASEFEDNVQFDGSVSLILQEIHEIESELKTVQRLFATAHFERNRRIRKISYNISSLVDFIGRLKKRAFALQQG